MNHIKRFRFSNCTVTALQVSAFGLEKPLQSPNGQLALHFPRSLKSKEVSHA